MCRTSEALTLPSWKEQLLGSWVHRLRYLHQWQRKVLLTHDRHLQGESNTSFNTALFLMTHPYLYDRDQRGKKKHVTAAFEGVCDEDFQLHSWLIEIAVHEVAWILLFSQMRWQNKVWKEKWTALEEFLPQRQETHTRQEDLGSFFIRNNDRSVLINQQCFIFGRKTTAGVNI